MHKTVSAQCNSIVAYQQDVSEGLFSIMRVHLGRACQQHRHGETFGRIMDERPEKARRHTVSTGAFSYR